MPLDVLAISFEGLFLKKRKAGINRNGTRSGDIALELLVERVSQEHQRLCGPCQSGSETPLGPNGKTALCVVSRVGGKYMPEQIAGSAPLAGEHGINHILAYRLDPTIHSSLRTDSARAMILRNKPGPKNVGPPRERVSCSSP